MALSGSVDFTNTMQEIITDAFFTINVIGESDQLGDYDYAYGVRTLNRMVKEWQASNIHLWVKQTVTMFLENGQNEYNFTGSASTNTRITNQYYRTKIATAGNSGDSTIYVDSSVNMTVNDKIGINLDNNTRQWTTISGIPVAGEVQISDVLTDDIAVGNYVYNYTNNINIPFDIYDASRTDLNSIDVPLSFYSYNDYFRQPNKTSSGTPVSWNYDRQLDSAVIRIWPVPNNLNFLLKLVVARKLQDLDVNADNFDFPQEWLEALLYNLVIRLAPTYGKADSNNFQAFILLAKNSLTAAMNQDREPGSLYLQPAYRGYRYNGR